MYYNCHFTATRDFSTPLFGGFYYRWPPKNLECNRPIPEDIFLSIKKIEHFDHLRIYSLTQIIT